MNESAFTRYLEYIDNTGGEPRIEWFDDDFEPVGPMARNNMKQLGLIEERDGKIFRKA